MKVIQHIERAAGRPFVSVEIIPPKRGGNVQQLYQAIESVVPFKPPFIDVTSHAAEVIWEEMPDGTFKRRVKRKSPGTFGLCAAIKYKYNIDPVPHVLCSGFTREETEDALIELNYLGVENILAIRGDSNVQKPVPEGRSVNRYAADLVAQVDRMNHGHYLDQLIDAAPTSFCVGVAAYPEKHFESPNLAFDVQQLLRKQELGAHYAATQLFYDNQKYLDYVAAARAAGVTMPLIPGLKILTKRNQLNVLPRTFFINLPDELVDQVLAARDDAAVLEVGVNWAYRQAIELLENDVPCLHFYIMQNTTPFLRLMERLEPVLKKMAKVPAA